MAAVADQHPAVYDFHLRERNPGRRDRAVLAGRAAQVCKISQIDTHDRPLDGHLDNVDLARKKRRQLHQRAKTFHGNRRLGALADADIGKTDRRRRQNPQIGFAGDLDRRAEKATRLTLERFAIARPVDQQRPQQRREQDGDDEETDGNVDLVQNDSPCGSVCATNAAAIRRKYSL